MSRREIRDHIFKMLFQTEFHAEEEMEEQFQMFMDQMGDVDKTKRAYMEQKLQDICKNLKQIDQMINEKTTGWKTNRMAKVDLALIRLAVYEIKYEADMPTSVAINEAVELAKIYSSDGAPAFVNGVLAKLV